MSIDALLQRLRLLQSQDRWAESRSLLENYLADEPDNWVAQLYYVGTLLNLGEKKLARELIGPLLEENPDNGSVIRMAAQLELVDKKPKVAEQYANVLLQMNPEDDDAHALMAKIKLDQRNYDAALRYTEQALALEPENQEALNYRIYLSGLLNTGDTDKTIAEALHLNPEDADTIANHGYQLLRQGNVDEALERLKYALSISPTNQLARYAMLEALRARFWPYRLFMKYQEAMAKLSGNASFGLMIGLWLGVQALSRLGSNNPDLAVFTDPLVYLLVGLFILTWVIHPIMNFYLLTNKYGRLLLDEDDKLMATLVGGSLVLGAACLLAYFVLGWPVMAMLAVAGLLLTIPFGSFLRPVAKDMRQLTTAATVVLTLLALGAIFSANILLINVALFGLLGYQFMLNAIMARAGGRTFD